jgi:tetratricopeptide (TPR) repeat protein
VTSIRCAIGVLLATGVVAALIAGHPTAPSVDGASREAEEALELALAPLPVRGESDRSIAALQARAAADPAQLERLGWAFAQRAQDSGDPGFFLLTLAAASALARDPEQSFSADLLRGHALLSLHRFAEAEPLARRLARERGAPFDFALLGDVLFDRGRLAEAERAYARLLEMRPDGLALARAAQLMHARGSTRSAISLMERAARAMGARPSGARSWMLARLAVWKLEEGDLPAAGRAALAALEARPDSAAALLAASRVALASGQPARALEHLRAAERISPLPDVLWALADALRAAGREEEAGRVEARLIATGAGADPRGLARFLATRGIELERARALVRDELAQRSDAATHEVAALVELARGELAAARSHAERALASGTRDPQVQLAIGAVAARRGDPADARAALGAARSGAAALLPSQRAFLDARLSELGVSAGTTRAVADRNP